MYGEFRASPLGEDEGITIFSLKGHFGGSALGLLLLGKSYQEVTCKDETYTERRSASISFSVILCQGVTKFLVHLHSVLKLAEKSPFFKTPTFSRVFHPNFLTIFLVKSKLSTAKKSKTTTFSRVFRPKKSTIFSGNQS